MSWSSASLGELCEIQIGRTPSRSNPSYWQDGTEPWVSISDMKENVVASTRERITRKGASESGARRVAAGTLLMSFKLSIGKLAFAGTDLFTNEAIAALPLRNGKIDSRFLWRALEKIDFSGAGNRAVMGNTLNKAALNDIPISFPSLNEQRRIAAILDKADALRQKRKRALALLDSLTQSIFLDMFGQTLTAEARVERRPLADMIADGDRLNYGVVQPGDQVEGGVPIVRVSDLRGGRVSHADLKSISPRISADYGRSILNGSEILVSCVGSIGEVALATEEERGFNVARAVARIPLDPRFSRTYVAEFLRTDHVQRYFTKELRTVSQPTLNIKQLSQTIVPLPPPDQMKSFERKAAEVTAMRGQHFAAAATQELLFASLQHRAFSGQL